MTQFPFPQFAEFFNTIPFNRMLGLVLKKIDPKEIVLTFQMTPDLIGNYFHGILHGGVISSVLDMAGGVAAISSAIQKNSHLNIPELQSSLQKSSTINLHVDFLRPGKGENFTAKASVTHAGNKITFTQMELWNEEHLIAQASGTYAL